MCRKALNAAAILVAVLLANGSRVAAQDTLQLRLPAGDAVLDARLYRAAGPGAHPTVLLLHGYPGNQQNADIAEAVQAAGWNAVLMHYRGSWGSTGEFSVRNAPADVRTVLAALRSPAAAKDWGIAADRIALVGHSMGGALALLVAAHDPAVHCVAGLAPSNVAVQARQAANNPAYRAGWTDALAAPTRAAAPPIRFPPGAEAKMVDYIIEHADSLDLVAGAPLLADRPVLLVGGSDDQLAPPAQHVQPLLDALKAAGARQVTSAFLPDDHNFSAGRDRLVELVVGWLQSACR